MSGDDKEFAQVLFLGALVLLVGVLIGGLASYAGWEKEAVELGHAEYYIDADHEKQWRWLTRADEVNAAEPKAAPDTDTEKQP